MVTYYSYTIIAGIHRGPSNVNLLFLYYYSVYGGASNSNLFLYYLHFSDDFGEKVLVVQM